MHTGLTLEHFAWALSAIFAAVGFVHVVGFNFIANAYRHWQYPVGFREVTGVLLLLAAAFLAFPMTRFFGIVLAGIVMFLSSITLINHRQYGYAMPIVALLFTLVPVSLAGSV